MPDDFIPAAEASGLILPIGEWVLRTACIQLRAWQEAGLRDLQMSVNLSPRQFQQRDLVEMIRGVLWETGLTGQSLQLEITEAMAMRDINHAIDTLGQLKEMGIHLAIDDFGTGYCSLAYLRELPLSAIKIDKSFISDISLNQKAAEITCAVIGLSHSLKLKTIAEGVETNEQYTFLKQQGCDEVQGFLLCRPMPGEKVREFLSVGLWPPVALVS